MSSQESQAALAAIERVSPGRRKANRRHLMACALACFDELGLESTKIEDIRARADSSIGSIYHHFGNKEGLLAAVIEEFETLWIERLQKRVYLQPGVEDRIEALLRSWVEIAEESPHL